MSRERVRHKPLVVGQTLSGNDVVQSVRGNYYIRLKNGEPLNLTEQQYRDGIARGNIRPVEV